MKKKIPNEKNLYINKENAKNIQKYKKENYKVKPRFL